MSARLPVVFLVGAARSGTSLLYRALSLHPQATYVSNWLRRRPGWQGLSALNRLPRMLPGLQLRYWFGEESNAYRYGKKRSAVERFFPAPVEGGPVFTACGVEPGATPAGREAARLRRAFAGLVRYGGGATVVSKRIANNRLIPFLAEAFPEARFVSIIRDGRAVAYSLSRVDWWAEADLWWLGMTHDEWRARGHGAGDEWELCARAWVEDLRIVEAALAGLDPARVLEVSYEDVVADPIARLQQIGTFSGLTESPRWTGSLRQLRFPNRNEGWRAALGAEEVARIERVQGEELNRHGYR